MEDIIATAQAAGRAILQIYNSEVGFACVRIEVSGHPARALRTVL